MKACIDDGFDTWYAFRDTHHDRRRLRREIKSIKKRMRTIIYTAADQSRDRRAMRFCRQQRRSLFDYLAQVMCATARGKPPPSLIPG